jgi:hypothetical protein
MAHYPAIKKATIIKNNGKEIILNQFINLTKGGYIEGYNRYIHAFDSTALKLNKRNAIRLSKNDIKNVVIEFNNNYDTQKELLANEFKKHFSSVQVV